MSSTPYNLLVCPKQDMAKVSITLIGQFTTYLFRLWVKTDLSSGFACFLAIKCS